MRNWTTGFFGIVFGAQKTALMWAVPTTVAYPASDVLVKLPEVLVRFRTNRVTSKLLCGIETLKMPFRAWISTGMVILVQRLDATGLKSAKTTRISLYILKVVQGKEENRDNESDDVGCRRLLLV